MIAFLLSLTACSSHEALVEDQLNAYAAISTDRAQLPLHLSGAALESAIESLDLLDELALVSRGASSFTDTQRLSNNRYRSCLDVSNTQFFTTSGDPVVLERTERQSVEIGLTSGLISDIELMEQPC